MNLSRRSFIASTAVGTFAVTGARASRLRVEEDLPLKQGALGKYVGTLPPGRYDSHIHVYDEGSPKPEFLAAKLREAGLTGGCIFSRPPVKRNRQMPSPLPPERAMEDCIAWASASSTIYPFYWIDPSAPNACDLVDLAVEKGIYGFKVIRGDGLPCDGKTLPVYRKIAAAGKPLTFHTGILWDGQASSDNFRPANWEPLIDIPGLRFALAHVSWPWCDECIAVYGKLLNAIATRGADDVPEMFIDTTPGTPKIYRRDVLAKIYTVGYDVMDHVQFGTDCSTYNYNVDWVKDWFKTDDEIMSGLGLNGRIADSYSRGSLQRYLFGGNGGPRKVPVPDGTQNG